MRKTIKYTLLSCACAMTVFPSVAISKDLGEGWLAKERFQIRARAIGILADGDGNVDGTSTSTDIDNAYVPEVDFTYFLTENVALEAVVATAQHTVSAGGNNLGDVWILPPTLVLQYHFQPDKKFSPYIGAGINYSIFYAEDEADGISDFDVDNGFGLAVQAGADYWINDNWGLNFDIKYIDLNVDASISNGTTRASSVDVDPIIVGAGVSYRF